MVPSNEQWIWKLYGFVDKRGIDIVQKWYESVDDDVKAEFDVSFKYLREAPDTKWALPYARALHGKCKEFIEVRFKVNRIQYRAIGFRGPERRVYTVVRMTDKKGFDPACIKETNIKRLIESNIGKYRHEPECFSDLVKEAQAQEI